MTKSEMLSRSIRLVNEYFDGDMNKVAKWYNTDNPLLGDVSPLSMILWEKEEKLLKFIETTLDENKIGKI